MCLGTTFWRDTYAGLAEQAVRGLGVDGLYMDQACSSLECYDPTHGHPAGGGRYWMEGFRQLSEEIRKRCAWRRTPALAGEGCGEPWLPYLDVMLSLQVSRERYAAPDGWETIPFFQAVYHPCAVTFGNYASLTLPPYDDLWPAESAPEEPLKLLDRKFSTQFCLEQARTFVWGQQPMIANFLPAHLDERAAELAFVLRLAEVRSRALPYLLHGTLLRAPDLNAPVVEADFSRLSIYAGQDGVVKAFRKEAPLALASAWRAPDGTVAFALASVAERPLVVRVPLDRVRYGIPSDAVLYRIDEAGRSEVGAASRTDSTLEVRLPARGACVLELATAGKRHFRGGD
jgi:hypothetical protein